MIDKEYHVICTWFCFVFFISVNKVFLNFRLNLLCVVTEMLEYMGPIFISEDVLSFPSFSFQLYSEKILNVFIDLWGISYVQKYIFNLELVYNCWIYINEYLPTTYFQLHSGKSWKKRTLMLRFLDLWRISYVEKYIFNLELVYNCCIYIKEYLP